MPAFVSFPGSATPKSLHDKYLPHCFFRVSSVRGKACSGSLVQSCPVLSLHKFHFVPDLDFLGPSWGWLSLPLPMRAQNRAFPAFVQPRFCSLPFCSTFILSSWGWAKPNYASSSPVRYFKDLQREKVHFSWNILNNLSCMAYLKKKKVLCKLTCA